MKVKEYEMSDGRKAVFEYDENGVGKITLECMDELMEMVADRPQGWIPCSERLPSEQGEYLVTVTYEGDTYVECLHYGKPTMANREVKGECFYDSDDEWGDVVYDTEAIAWMPLPKPYGEPKGE